MTHTMQRAVVLAAGRGTRMMPLTADRPKSLIPVAGVPILERILRGLYSGGVREALIIHGYLGQMIVDTFGDGARLGLRLQYAAQPVPNGTAGALLLAESFCGEAPFVLHWGDILIDPINYPALLAAFNECQPAALLGVNWLDDPSAGAAVYHEGGRVTAIIEKPGPGTSTTHWNAAGVNLLGPRCGPTCTASPPRRAASTNSRTPSATCSMPVRWYTATNSPASGATSAPRKSSRH